VGGRAGGKAVDAHSVILVCMHRAPETYIHRVGRTGRFGAEGIAVSLVANNQVLDSFPPSLPPFLPFSPFLFLPSLSPNCFARACRQSILSPRV
jgi:hypothetical protein